jgi:hypothetical protein
MSSDREDMSFEQKEMSINDDDISSDGKDMSSNRDDMSYEHYEISFDREDMAFDNEEMSSDCQDILFDGIADSVNCADFGCRRFTVLCISHRRSFDQALVGVVFKARIDHLELRIPISLLSQNCWRT